MLRRRVLMGRTIAWRSRCCSNPGGPLAVLAGSRVTMPYGNSVLGLELLKQLFADHHVTLGEVVMRAKQQALQPADSGLRKTVDQIAAGFLPKSSDRQQDRVEHVQMYNLLGDPLLRLRRPRALPLSVSIDPDNPHQLLVTGESPLAGLCRLRVMQSRDQVSTSKGARSQFALNEASQEEYRQQYQAANQLALTTQTIQVSQGVFSAIVPLPEGDHDNWLLVGNVAGPTGLAAGHAVCERARPDGPAGN